MREEKSDRREDGVEDEEGKALVTDVRNARYINLRFWMWASLTGIVESASENVDSDRYEVAGGGVTELETVANRFRVHADITGTRNERGCARAAQGGLAHKDAVKSALSALYQLDSSCRSS